VHLGHSGGVILLVALLIRTTSILKKLKTLLFLLVSNYKKNRNKRVKNKVAATKSL
jgi:hypothetical protein